MNKLCTKCKIIKSIENFWPAKDKKSGTRPWCKLCSVKSHREWADNNYEKYLGIMRTTRNRTKAKVLTYYGNGNLACVMCGEKRLVCLTIDHIYGGGTKHFKQLNKYGAAFYQWLKSNDFPDGFQTLCANCQLIKQAKNGECLRPDKRKLT